MTILEGTGADSLLIYKLGANTAGLAGVFASIQHRCEVGLILVSHLNLPVTRQLLAALFWKGYINGSQGTDKSFPVEQSAPDFFSLVSLTQILSMPRWKSRSICQIVRSTLWICLI
jgi:hypothetical protein